MFTEFEKHFLHRATLAHQELGTRLFPSTTPMEVTFAKRSVAGPFASRPEPADLRPIRPGTDWGSGSDHAWFLFRGELPESWDGKEAVAWVDVGTEGLVFDLDGNVTQGIAPGRLFDNVAWRGTRPTIDLAPLRRAGREIAFWVQASCFAHPTADRGLGEPVRSVPQIEGGTPRGCLHRAELALFDREVWDLYMDLEVLLDLIGSLPAASVRRAKLLRHVTAACDILGSTPGDPAAARAALRPAFEKPAAASDLRVHAVGHGHLDTAWLWTTATGRQKCARTAANQLRLMEQYPEHVFGLSAALHYRWLSEDHPALFERVRQRVAEGRWEIQGSMWVEADAHLPSGESLVRQFLHGARWFKQHFGRASDFLWLPDVFGYAGSLPGIMRHCGADALVTQKISWGQFHPFPHNAFRWRGIDGSEVIAYFPPENDYATNLFPSQLRAAQDRCAERDRLDDMLSLFGYGDGGGGPHAKHLERARRCRDLEGCPPVRVGGAGAFLDVLRARAGELELWDGPFYLENHRGTFTTQAAIKKANRQIEESLQAIEILWSCAPARDWPGAELDPLWKTALLNQFHDIIPGSSIREVNLAARKDYAEALRAIGDLAGRFAREHLVADPGACTLFNSLPYAWSGSLRLPGGPAGTVPADASGEPLPHEIDPATGDTTVLAQCPPLGYATVRHVAAADRRRDEGSGRADGSPVLENDLVRYEFDGQARLVRAFDKTLERELVPPGQPGNVFSLYHDFPCEWDAWNLDITYERQLVGTARTTAPPVARCSAIGQSIRASLQVGQSTIEQHIFLENGSRRLEFQTRIDWKEEHRHLRVAFPVAIANQIASYEIPYGVITQPVHRNTSRDMAMFEHCGHRFCDLSNPDYGVALLNDCKYGHKILGNVMELALLRAPVYPDPSADREEHSLRFAFFPHAGPLAQSEVLAEASRFNRAPLVFPSFAVPEVPGALQPPVRLSDDLVSLEALKRTEDGDAWLLRAVERRGRSVKTRLLLPSPATLVETDGLERSEGAPTRVEKELGVTFAPFQIRSWKIILPCPDSVPA